MNNNPTVKEIITDYLKANKFDGLFIDGLCRCEIDDLEQCDGMYSASCQPGYKYFCDENAHKDCGEECEFREKGSWCIAENKPEEATNAKSH